MLTTSQYIGSVLFQNVYTQIDFGYYQYNYIKM
jgi:hypothetical protein